MKGYWIARVDVSDAETYGRYAVLATKAIKDFGGKFLARGGQFIAKEGKCRTRNVIVEFDSLEIAEQCYASEDYKKALKLAEVSAEREFVIVEGC